jgi:hypothetical protein
MRRLAPAGAMLLWTLPAAVIPARNRAFIVTINRLFRF